MRDKNSNNPRIQCSKCGRWMRLHSSEAKTNTEMISGQRFFPCYKTKNDVEIEAIGDVCVRCMRQLPEYPKIGEKNYA